MKDANFKDFLSLDMRAGKVKRSQGFRSHKASHKTQKQKRQLRKSALVHPSDQKRINSLLQD